MNNILYLPHGGGPLPLFGHEGHLEMISFLKNVSSMVSTPSAIIMISAHWEAHKVSITHAANPELIYDYSGFPKEAYDITYPAPGHPELANKINDLLLASNIETQLENTRGFDHGMFVPLKLMYPDADIPCIQLSLVKGLDPATHIKIGKALSNIEDNNILFVGSGMSFHNMREFGGVTNESNLNFEAWLVDTCTNPNLTLEERETRLIDWTDAPSARFCHPREEHLIPLHVCYGIAQAKGELVFDGTIMGKKTSAYLW